MLRIILDKLLKEAVFTISMALALITSFFSVPRLSYIDLRVMAALFNLMIVVLAFEKLNILDAISLRILTRFSDKRKVSLTLLLLTFFASMLLTNDVALITIIPLTLIIARRAQFNPWFLVILQTLAANIGSSLTPMGNPQNLFLFTYYNIEPIQFFTAMLPFVLTGLFYLILINIWNRKEPLQFTLDTILPGDRRKIAVYSFLFLIILLSVFRIIDYRIAFITVLVLTAGLDRELLFKVDYFLLGTFVFFFIAIGNLSQLPAINGFMQGLLVAPAEAYFSSIWISQIISNVPSAILLSRFTGHWREVLMGVNVGGIGTLVASLASLISYKFYAREYNGKAYLVRFHLINLVSLLLFSILVYLADQISG